MLIVRNETFQYYTEPFPITDEGISAWDSTATYDYADEVYDEVFVYRYAGSSSGNTTWKPSADADNYLLQQDAVDRVQKWVKVRTTNYWGMFDNKTTTSTADNTGLDFVIYADEFADTLSLLNIYGNTLTVTVYSDAAQTNVVQTFTTSLIDKTPIIDFYTYVYTLLDRDTDQLLLWDRNIYPEVWIRIQVTGTASIGRLICGKRYNSGCTTKDITYTPRSYSYKDTDVFGNVTTVKRDAVYDVDADILIDRTKVPEIKRKFKELDAVPVLFVLDEDYNATDFASGFSKIDDPLYVSDMENHMVFGYWTNATVIVDQFDISTMNLTIEELI